MAFQYQGGNLMSAAAMQNQQQQSFFDNLARGIEGYQRGRALDLQKQKLENDPEVLAQKGFMVLAQGGTPDPQQMAAMKWADAQNRAKITTDQYGNRISNQSFFDLLGGMPQQPSQPAPQSPVAPPERQGFNVDQFMPEPPGASTPIPSITNKAEEMAYQSKLNKQAEQDKADIGIEKANKESIPLITSMRDALSQYQGALNDLPKMQSGPVYGRIADLYNVPEYENLQAVQNTVALQARNLLKLPASGFSDADRTFLEQIAGGKYQWKSGYQKAIDRIDGMLSSEEKRLGISKQKNPAKPQPVNNNDAFRRKALENEARRRGLIK